MVRNDSNLSEKELAILARFAVHMRLQRSITMPIREALGSDDPAANEAFNSLIDRGWILTSAAVHWRLDDVCMLCGGGLKVAQAMRMPESGSGSP